MKVVSIAHVQLAMPACREAGTRATLAGIYNWFTKRFDTAHLKDAKALLDEFSN